MFGTILKATNSPFQKGMTFCRSIYVKEVMKLLAFIFEQPSYVCYFYVCDNKWQPASRIHPDQARHPGVCANIHICILN